MPKRQLSKAVVNYAAFNNPSEDERLSRFVERLSGELQLHTGSAFPIFMDKKNIQWGQDWKSEVKHVLDASNFFIPVITPGYFTSEKCRKELESFFAIESNRGRRDLIFPIHYVDTPQLTAPQSRMSDPLVKQLASRQLFDWRELRFEPLSSPKVAEALSNLAAQISDSLRGQTAPGVRARKVATTLTRRVDEKTEPNQHVVNRSGGGDFKTVTDAISAAAPGDRIIIRRGRYREGLVIDKVLEIIGEGAPGEVVIEALGQDAIFFKTTMGRVANLTLRQSGGGDWYGVDIAQGRLDMEDCDISSKSLAGVAIHAGADPILRRNKIRGGVFFYNAGQGTLEDNEIYGCAETGVEVNEGSNPTLRRNNVHDNKQTGILIFNALGTLEDNEISKNGYAGVEVSGSGANPTLRRNNVHDNKQSGVFIYDFGQGTLEDNTIIRNGLAGVEAKTGARPTVRRNRINRNKGAGVWAYEGGGGVFKENDLTKNQGGAWEVSSASSAKVKKINNKEE